MKSHIYKLLCLLLSLSLQATNVDGSSIRGSGGDIINYNNSDKQRRDLKKRDNDRWERDDDDDEWSRNRGGSVREMYDCIPSERLTGRTFYVNPYEEGNNSDGGIDEVAYTDGMCNCGGGCCRIYSWLICDESGDGLPYMQCICNENTALPNTGVIRPDDSWSEGSRENINNSGQQSGGFFTFVTSENNNNANTAVQDDGTFNVMTEPQGIPVTSPPTLAPVTSPPTLAPVAPATPAPVVPVTPAPVEPATPVVPATPVPLTPAPSAAPATTVPIVSVVQDDRVDIVDDTTTDYVLMDTFGPNDCNGLASPFSSLDSMSCSSSSSCTNPKHCCLGNFCICAEPLGEDEYCLPPQQTN